MITLNYRKRHLFFAFCSTLVLVSLPKSVSAATIQLFFDAFIPEERAINPAADILPPFYTSFIGDNRGFSNSATRSGEARLFTNVTLDLDAPEPLISSFTDTSTTIGFRLEEEIEVADEFKSTPNSRVTAIRNDNSIILDVFAEARNPLIEQNLPPDIETPPAQYDYQITLEPTENAIAYTLAGFTRAYPAYSVYIEDTPILLNPTVPDSNLLFLTEPIAETRGQIAIATSVSEPANFTGLLVLGSLLLFSKGKNQKWVKSKQKLQ